MKLTRLVETSSISVVKATGESRQMADGGSTQARAHIAAALRNQTKGYEVWVATLSGEIVGAISLCVNSPRRLASESVDPPDKVLYLSDLGSLYRGCGTLLVEQAMERAKEANLPIWVAPTPTSLDFYLKLGFTQMDRGWLLQWMP